MFAGAVKELLDNVIVACTKLRVLYFECTAVQTRVNPNGKLTSEKVKSVDDDGRAADKMPTAGMPFLLEVFHSVHFGHEIPF